mgnify:CR=1 FL=1
MSKRKFLLPIATFGLLLSSLVACGGNNSSSTQPVSSNGESGTSQNVNSSSQDPVSSQDVNTSSKADSSKPAPHVHAYEADGEAVKNSDEKNVNNMKCKDDDSRYIAIAFGDYSSKSADFDSKISTYNNVPEEIRNSSFLLAKNGTVSWKISVDKAITDAELAFGCVYTGGDHGSQGAQDGGAYKYSIKVNNGEFADWDIGSETYDSLGLSQTARAYATFAKINLVKGENTITLRQNNAGYRLLFGGEVRVNYAGTAKAVATEGYKVTFAPEHCKVLVYTGKDYASTPVELATAWAMDENGIIKTYDELDEFTPQINFKVVCDEGYTCNASNITVEYVGENKPYKNIKQNPAKDEEPAVDDDTLFRITKIQADITVKVAPVQGEQAPGHKVTFVTDHCSITSYIGKKNEEGTNIDVENAATIYARSKDAPYDYSFDTSSQINFAVVCDEGYEFVPDIVDDKVDFIVGTYNKFKAEDGFYNITKIESDLTITITATQASPTPEKTLLKEYDFSEISAGNNGGSNLGDTFIKLGSANNSITLSYNATDLRDNVTLSVLLTTKATNAAQAGIYKQGSTVKFSLKVNDENVTLPTDDARTLADIGVDSQSNSGVSDGGSPVAVAVWFDFATISLNEGANTIVLTYLGGGYSLDIGGFKLAY